MTLDLDAAQRAQLRERHACAYRGTVSSLLRRVRRVLAKNGIALGKVLGRYHPFGEPQTVVTGWNASRVGCSRTVSLRYWDRGDRLGREERRQLPAIVALLRADGLQFDDAGRLDAEWES